ncbi:MAG TPA: AAA family ATPase [Pyrinomonadaceae bacterium]|nr:AAA family ATPase [Pyrinomonadaceae bacterium]
MTRELYTSEIRNSLIRTLLQKVRKRNYEVYLVSIRLERIRFFKGAEITFDFPVTALIGPNGGGKSTILGAAGCPYRHFRVESVFQKSRVGDASMDDWVLQYDMVDRRMNPSGTIRLDVTFNDNRWSKSSRRMSRQVKLFGINRTVSAVESTTFTHKKVLRAGSDESPTLTLSTEPITDIQQIRIEAERILGKSLSHFQLFRIIVRRHKAISELVGFEEKDGTQVPVYKLVPGTVKRTSQKLMFVGGDGTSEYSELNFGAGERSVINLVAAAESLPDNSLLLIEEIENGLHPVAVRRLVEYLIDIAGRKKLQVIFTTHSDYAIAPLPPEAIWASIDGKLQQGKLSIDLLRVISGRIDRRLAIFVEDEFAKSWIEAILRELLPEHLDEVGVYAVSGDGNAVKMHLGLIANPAVTFQSICLVDGDSKQSESVKQRIYRFPGETPELTVFNSVLADLENNIALLTVACQRSVEKQEIVANEIRKVSRTNRDPHLLFNQVGLNIGFVPESIVRGAFLSIWLRQNPEEAKRIRDAVKGALEPEPAV